MTPDNPDYPVRLQIDYPHRLSRLLIFVKAILAIPHFIILWVLGIGAWVALVISWFAVLITGSYPESLFRYIAGVMRWAVRVSAYVFLLTDAYPPFSLDDDPHYPVRLEVDYPARIPRWAPLINWLLVIPVLFLAVILYYVSFVVVVGAWFAILITGRIPASLFNFVTITFRWIYRSTAFEYWMTEQYPPFVWA